MDLLYWYCSDSRLRILIYSATVDMFPSSLVSVVSNQFLEESLSSLSSIYKSNSGSEELWSLLLLAEIVFDEKSWLLF